MLTHSMRQAQAGRDDRAEAHVRASVDERAGVADRDDVVIGLWRFDTGGFEQFGVVEEDLRVDVNRDAVPVVANRGGGVHGVGHVTQIIGVAVFRDQVVERHQPAQ